MSMAEMCYYCDGGTTSMNIEVKSNCCVRIFFLICLLYSSCFKGTCSFHSTGIDCFDWGVLLTKNDYNLYIPADPLLNLVYLFRFNQDIYAWLALVCRLSFYDQPLIRPPRHHMIVQMNIYS